MIFVSLIVSLTLTLVIELPIARIQRIPLKRAIAVNVLTNPLAVILYHWAKYFSFNIIIIILFIELLVVITEGYFYRGYHPHPWVFSIAVNTISFGIGLLL